MILLQNQSTYARCAQCCLIFLALACSSMRAPGPASSSMEGYGLETGEKNVDIQLLMDMRDDIISHGNSLYEKIKTVYDKLPEYKQKELIKICFKIQELKSIPTTLPLEEMRPLFDSYQELLNDISTAYGTVDYYQLVTVERPVEGDDWTHIIPGEIA